MRIAAGLAASMVCGLAFAQTEEYQAAIRHGVELHDRGEFDAAIKVYEALLADQPGDPVAMYEIGLSYQAKRDYAHCMEFASQVAAKESPSQAGGFTLLANCQDDAGHIEQAVATFKQAVEKFPRDVMLNLNYGLTLVRLEQAADARRVLEVAIEAAPGFASPYRAYAIALDQQSYPAAAVLARLRFIVSEPESERSIDAAKLIVEAVATASSAAKDKQIKVTMSEDDKTDAAAALAATELAFGIAAVSEDAISKELAKETTSEWTASARFVNSLQLFVTMRAEMADKGGKREAPWPAVLQPLTFLSEKEALEPFLYHVAALGRSEGAVQWINEHSDSMEQLGDAINEYHARFKRQ